MPALGGVAIEQPCWLCSVINFSGHVWIMKNERWNYNRKMNRELK
jgi:hypothetical protein